MATQMELPLEQEKKEEDTRLSYSSANLLRNCEQKYAFYKVSKTDKDPDAGGDTSHFNLGTSFHYILEMSMHQKPEKMGQMLEYCVQELGLKEDDTGLLHAMILQYLRLRKQGNFRAIACEYKIDAKNTLGYVDVIEVVDKGQEKIFDMEWTISDLKTASTFYESKIAELSKDRQLNLYGSYHEEIAKAYGLDPKKFIGCRYLVTTKSKAKQRAKESYNDFVMRLVEGKNVKSFAVFIPKALMDFKGARKEHEDLYKKSMKLRSGKAKPTKNFTYCQAYFRPCDYFSQCHGMTYTEFLENNQIIVDAIK